MGKSRIETGKMVRLAVLAAILIIMGYTPLGYLRAGPVSITFNMIPVVIGAIVLGPAGGAILGAVFGLTSFSQCFGADPFGVMLLNFNPVMTFVMCVIPRVLAGWLPGLIHKALVKGGKVPATVSAGVTCLAGSLLNTIFFVSALLLLFSQTAVIAEAFGTNNVGTIIAILVTSNALIEAAVCTVAGAAVGRALAHFLPVKTLAKG
jgi:uncharacterized membrane protein